jgi:hypothetical protein
MVLESLQLYDKRAQRGDVEKRSDFLGYLRQQEKSGGSAINTRDIMNHLINNLYVT